MNNDKNKRNRSQEQREEKRKGEEPRDKQNLRKGRNGGPAEQRPARGRGLEESRK